MRHLRNIRKLGRTSQHRDAMLANMAASLIQHSRIKTTLAKAKALRPVAEKLVTMGKKGTLHHRRLAVARLKGQREAAAKLFRDIAPRFKERQGGYTRIVKLGPRNSDASLMALIEWVDFIPGSDAPVAQVPAEAKKEKTGAAKVKADKTEAKGTPKKEAKS